LSWTQVVSASTSPGVTCNISSVTPTTGASGADISISKARCPSVAGPPPTTWTVTINYTASDGVSPPSNNGPIPVTGVEP